MSVPAPGVRFHLPITTEADLREYVWQRAGIEIPDVQVCKHHSTPWRAFCDSYFRRQPITVWEASRGFGGKTFMMALLGAVIGETMRCDVSILGGSGRQSKKCHDYLADLWTDSYAPTKLLDEALATETRLRWGNKITALPASTKAARGPHVAELLIDEADEMDLTIFDTAMGQTMSQRRGPDREIVRPHTTISSTHQYPDGTMTEVKRRAAERGWGYHEWCYRESAEPHGWLLRADIDQKRAEVTKAMWEVEYDLQEPSAEGRAIDTDSVMRLFDPDRGEWEGNDGELITIRDYERRRSYACGADWARKRDWTVLAALLKPEPPKRSTKTVDPFELVSFLRVNKEPWPKMMGRFDAMVQRYHATAAHDATGIGDAIDQHLKIDADPVLMVGRARDQLLTRYIVAIEADEIRAPRIAWPFAEHRYATRDDVFGKGHCPDSLVAMAMAYYAATLKTKPPMIAR